MFFWGGAAGWNVCTVVFIIKIVHGGAAKGDVPVAIAFSVVGAGWLALAVLFADVQISSWRKFGRSVFEMQSVPAAIGGTLAGAIRLGRPNTILGEVKLTLSCVRLETRGNSGASEVYLWDAEHVLPSCSGAGIPVLFAIPADGVPETTAKMDNVISWRLRAESSDPAIGYAETFEVPVFSVPLSAEQTRLGETSRQQARTEVAEYQLGPDSPVSVREGVADGAEFLFPARRNPGMIVLSAVMLAFFTGVMVALLHSDAKFVLKAAAVLADILIALSLLSACFLTVVVAANSNGISVTKRVLFYSKTTKLSASSIREVMVRPWKKNPSFHEIRVLLESGREVLAASGISNKREADGLALQMARCVGKVPRERVPVAE